MNEGQTKADNKNDDWDWMFACCPKCRTTLVQAENGLNGFIRCPQCGVHVHIVLKNSTVFMERKR